VKVHFIWTYEELSKNISIRKGGSLAIKALKLLWENYSLNIKLVITGHELWPLREKTKRLS